MKIRVISEFYDKFHTSTLFKVGTVLDFDDDRAKDVIAKKLAEPFQPEKKEEQKPAPAPAPAPEVKVEDAKPADDAPAEGEPAKEAADAKPADDKEAEVKGDAKPADAKADKKAEK